MKRALLTSILVVTAFGGEPAAAQTTSAEAARQLFGPRGVAVAVSPELSEADQATVRELVRQGERAGTPFRFYASIAFSPEEGLLTEALQGAMGFHSPERADAAAIAACNAARRPGTRPCVIAGRVLPRGWEPRPLQLSFDATSAFDEVLRRAAPPKALAASPTGGAWGIGRGGDAAAVAVADCNRQASAAGAPLDCQVVVRD